MCVCRLCYKMVTHRLFDPCILTLIMLNMAIICMTYRSAALPILPCLSVRLCLCRMSVCVCLCVSVSVCAVCAVTDRQIWSMF